MALAVVGVSHQTAPVEVRERFAFLEDEIPEALRSIRAQCGVQEAVLLSTCNRTELYLYPVLDAEVLQQAERILAEKAGHLSRPASAYLYRLREMDAVTHLFRVASGLDSLVTGEAEIQGQVKDAYHKAAGVEATPPLAGQVLNRLFQSALAVGGRVRAETPLGEGAASVASVAVELARKIFGSLADRRVLVIGAGNTAERVVEALRREGARDVTVVNRTYERAVDLAERLNARALGLNDLTGVLRNVDIVLTSTAAPHAVLRRVNLREAFPSGPPHPLLIVDIAIPRDVDPEIGDEPNVFLYNVDDLRRIVDDALERRQEAVALADEIVSEQAHEFATWHASLEVVPVIRALRDRAEEIKDAELQRLLSRLALSGDSREAVAEFAQRLVNKLLHSPTVKLRQGAASGRAAELVDALRYLHDLDASDAGASAGEEQPPAEGGSSDVQSERPRSIRPAS
jgi:glutamyl-tRNA reductase